MSVGVTTGRGLRGEDTRPREDSTVEEVLRKGLLESTNTGVRGNS